MTDPARTLFGTFVKQRSEHIFNYLGCQHSENVYQKALVLQLSKKYHNVETERHVPILYKDLDNTTSSLGSERIDIFITHEGKKYLLELKSQMANIRAIEVAQVQRYNKMLEHTGVEVDESYVINFPQPSAASIPTAIQFKRIT